MAWAWHLVCGKGFFPREISPKIFNPQICRSMRETRQSGNNSDLGQRLLAGPGGASSRLTFTELLAGGGNRILPEIKSSSAQLQTSAMPERGQTAESLQSNGMIGLQSNVAEAYRMADLGCPPWQRLVAPHATGSSILEPGKVSAFSEQIYHE